MSLHLHLLFLTMMMLMQMDRLQGELSKGYTWRQERHMHLAVDISQLPRFSLCVATSSSFTFALLGLRLFTCLSQPFRPPGGSRWQLDWT